MVRLRANGNFAARVTNPQLFVNQIVGSQGRYTTDAIESLPERRHRRAAERRLGHDDQDDLRPAPALRRAGGSAEGAGGRGLREVRPRDDRLLRRGDHAPGGRAEGHRRAHRHGRRRRSERPTCDSRRRERWATPRTIRRATAAPPPESGLGVGRRDRHDGRRDDEGRDGAGGGGRRGRRRAGAGAFCAALRRQAPRRRTFCPGCGAKRA